MDISKLLALPFVEHKGEKVDRIYQIKPEEGVIDEVFRRIIDFDNSVESSFYFTAYGLQINGSYPEFEPEMNRGKGGRYYGRVGLLISGEHVGEYGTYLVTFQNTTDSCRSSHKPTPDLSKLLEDLIEEISPVI